METGERQMRIRRRGFASIGTVVASAALAVGLAACGSSSSSNGASGTTTAGGAGAATSTTAASGYNYGTSGAAQTTAPAAAAATVAIGTTSLGKVLVDSSGKTLYVFDSDSPGKSSCNNTCATAWPPLEVTGTPAYASGLTASMFSVITRDDGSKQVAVNGQPLYTWQGDAKAGDVTGQGVNGFHVVGTDGKKITNAG